MGEKPQKLGELEEREARARAMGGEKEIQKQHAGREADCAGKIRAFV